MSENKQKIEFTKKQFKTLLKLVYLGNWIANAQRDGSVENPHKEEYEKLENYIFSFAKQFGLDEWVNDEDAADGKFFPTRFFEEETDVQELIEEYDKETFWDELIHLLGDRDFYRHYSREEIRKMTQDERFNKLYEFIDRWADEMAEYGIERLKIDDEK